MLTPEEEKDLVDTGVKRYRIGYLNIQDRLWDFFRYYKIYHCDSDDDQQNVDGESNIFLPYAYSCIESVLPKIVDPILSRESIRIQPQLKKDTRKAENFRNIARTYYNSSDYQLDYIESERECCITGSAWEFDEWIVKSTDGKRKKKVEAITKAEGVIDDVKYEKYEKIPHKYIKYQGYKTRFPSIFHVLPDPNTKKVEDMAWIVFDEPIVALDSLRQQTYIDENNEIQKVYNFDKLDKDFQVNKKGYKQGSIKPINSLSDNLDKDIYGNTGNNLSDDTNRESDIDKVHIFTVYTPTEIYTIAQGKYLIRRITEPYDKPELKWRLRTFTPNKEALYGVGMIEKAEHLFYELNDTHNISMQNSLRIINQMFAVDESKLVDIRDLEHRGPGTNIRLKDLGDSSASNAITHIVQPNVMNEMAMIEGNTKGFIEQATASFDNTTGPYGVKMGHKTLGGLELIQSNINQRFTMIHRQRQANRQIQYGMMYSFYEQHLGESLAFYNFAKNGRIIDSVAYAYEDVDTEGRGFQYIIESDPSFGDTNAQRNQLMVLFDISTKYKEITRGMGGKYKDVNFQKEMENIFESFGQYDPEQMFMDNDEMSPDEEFKAMMSGQIVHPLPTENLTNHLAKHILQVQDPEITKLVQSGKLPPEIMKNIDDHINTTRQLIAEVAQDPMQLTQIIQGKGQQDPNDKKMQHLNLYQGMMNKTQGGLRT